MAQIVGIDLDDVIADFVSAWIQVLERSKGIKIQYEDIVAWHVEEIFPEINKKIIDETMSETWSKSSKTIRLVSKHLPAILDNLRQFFKVYIITAALGEDDIIKDWLRRNNIRYDKLVHVKQHSEKLADGIPIYVDDNPIMAEEFSRLGKTVILLQKPWNRHMRSAGNLIMAENWNEVERILIGIAEKNAQNKMRI